MVKPCFQHEVRGRKDRRGQQLPLTLTLSPVMAKPCSAWTGERGRYVFPAILSANA